MSKQTDGFGAGMAFVVLFMLVVTIVGSHGTTGSRDPITWGDIAWFLVIEAVIASCAIDLYKYWKNRD